MTVLQRKASMQQIGLPISAAIKLDNENIGGHLTPLYTLVSINVVTLRQARLVPGWVTAFGRVNHHGAEPGTQVYSA